VTFEYTINKKDSLIIISLKGELINKEQASKMLEDVDDCISKNETKILFHLNELKYLNSSGLNIFINVLTKIRKAGGDLAICCVNKKISELLLITKLGNIFNISENIEQGIAILNKL